jgi:DNA segregation ATPase FtsK/SpoIIIE-like protein
MEILIITLLIIVILSNLFIMSKIKAITNRIKKISEFCDRANNDPMDEGTDDELYEEAKKLIIEAGKASASYIQRRLRIGYARSARLLDTLEEEGVIGPAVGSEPREVYKKTENK